MSKSTQTIEKKVVQRLKSIAPNFAYEDEVVELARPKLFSYDSREAQKLISLLSARIKDLLTTGCSEEFAFDSVFAEIRCPVRVFFRVFKPMDMLRIKTDDGVEFYAMVAKTEEVYPDEIDDTFEDEVPDEDYSPENDDADPVDTRLWLSTDAGMDYVLLSHIKRVEFVPPESMDPALVGRLIGTLAECIVSDDDDEDYDIEEDDDDGEALAPDPLDLGDEDDDLPFDPDEP